MQRLIAHIFILFLFLSLMFSSCEMNNKNIVKGEIEGAFKDTLFLEQVELGKISIVAHKVLPKNGSFQFKFPISDEALYMRLRLHSSSIYLIVDSLQHIKVYSNKNTFGINDSIVGSVSSQKAQRVVQQVNNATQSLTVLDTQLQQSLISSSDYISAAEKVFLDLKAFLRSTIFEDTRSSVAYFSLFQQINGYYLFDSFDEKDIKVYAAVATPMQVHFPNSPRTKNIEDKVHKAMQRKKSMQERTLNTEFGKSFIDFELPDINGKKKLFSSLLGKATILDFSLYHSETAYAHNIMLQELHRIYAKKGLQIVQVSLDDEAVFKRVANQLPYQILYEQAGLSSVLLSTYNIDIIPTIFLLDKKGDIIAKNISFPVLEDFIKQLLLQ